MNKLKDSILFILESQPKEGIEILRLVKFLYLADYIYAKTFGDKKGFTGLYSRYEHGPVPVKFYETLETLASEGALGRTGNIISVRRHEGGIHHLTEKESACLTKIMEDFEGSSLTKVLRAAYSTEPMVEITKAEQSLGSKLLWRKMDFSNVEIHPMLQNDGLEIDFMDSPEFQENLRNA